MYYKKIFGKIADLFQVLSGYKRQQLLLSTLSLPYVTLLLTIYSLFTHFYSVAIECSLCE